MIRRIDLVDSSRKMCIHNKRIMSAVWKFEIMSFNRCHSCSYININKVVEKQVRFSCSFKMNLAIQSSASVFS